MLAPLHSSDLSYDKDLEYLTQWDAKIKILKLTDRKMHVCKLAVNLLIQVYLLILNHFLLYLIGENAENAFKSLLKETFFNNVLLSLS